MRATPATGDTKSSKSPVAAITYKLSNEVFKTLGWTSLPENAIVVPMITMKAKFSHNEISPWFAHRRLTRRYKDGRLLCLAREDGTGRILYPNGRTAIRIERGEQGKVTWIIVNTPGGVGLDGIRRPSQLCAVFDSLGNGVVYDCDKRKRLVYDQNHGMAWIRRDGAGRPMYWRWHGLAKADARQQQRNRSESFKVGSVTSQESSRLSASTVVSVASRYIDSAKIRRAAPIHPIIFQINRYIAVRIMSQSDVALTFFAHGEQTRLNIGTVISPFERLAVHKVRPRNVSERVRCPFEVLPARTPSEQDLRSRIEGERYPPCWNLN